MAWYRCRSQCFYAGRVWREGELHDFAEAPSLTGYFVLSSEDPKTQAPPLRMDRDKTIYLPENAWDDLRFPASGINPPGAASDPSRSTTTGLLVFSASLENVLIGVAPLPHKWAQGTRLHAHIHYLEDAASAGSHRWKFEYSAASIHGRFPGYSSVTTDIVAGGDSTSKHRLAEIGEIDMSDIEGVSSMIQWKLSRLGNDSADTYAGTISLLEFDIHYQIDSAGSGDEYAK